MFKNTYTFFNKKYIKKVKYSIISEDVNNYYLCVKDCFSLAISKKDEGKKYSTGYVLR